MRIELKVPEFGESVQEVHIAQWLRRQGDRVERDEDLVAIETDKATMELAAPADGVIAQILKQAGEMAHIGDVIAYIDDSPVDAAPKKGEDAAGAQAAAPPARETKAPPAPAPQTDSARRPAHEDHNGGAVHATPSARRELRKHGLEPEDVLPSGGRLQRQDVLRYVEEQQKRSAAPPQAPAAPAAPAPAAPTHKEDNRSPSVRPAKAEPANELEEVVPMSMIRRVIAERLVSAQQNAALLTTFNEVDMSAVMELRKRLGESFKERHGVKLGFMSFFVKAVVEALQEIPELNAEIRGNNIVYRHYQHIGIAIGSKRGLVVPVLRHAEQLGFADIEKAIGQFAVRAGEGKLLPDELQGGTFTITNGGVFGSLLSTPIVNPPQSGVLGMHAIEERPVARDGQVVIRPMMYVALTYDHRIVDGREAVTFLRRIKECIEDPSRLMLEV